MSPAKWSAVDAQRLHLESHLFNISTNLNKDREVTCDSLGGHTNPVGGGWSRRAADEIQPLYPGHQA